MPNIFFFDIDNTLLDHRTLTIPSSALAAIGKLKQEGHTVVIATGRSHEHARPFIDQIGPSFAITQNGARILQGEEEVLGIPLDRQALAGLFDWTHAQGHCYGVNEGVSGYINAPDPVATIPLDSVEMPYQTTSSFYLQRNVYQAWLFFDQRLDDVLVPAIRERFPEFDVVRWHRTAVDIQPHGINKWTGCQWVLAQTGYHPDQAIAFGDGLNDMQMLRGVGLGIAMDNGHPDLKAVADMIAPALHDDGIALTLNRIAAR
ncbi:MAG: HAD family hydrolase [Hyphomicrobiaceae bacterium]